MCVCVCVCVCVYIHTHIIINYTYIYNDTTNFLFLPWLFAVIKTEVN